MLAYSPGSVGLMQITFDIKSKHDIANKHSHRIGFNDGCDSDITISNDMFCRTEPTLALVRAT